MKKLLSFLLLLTANIALIWWIVCTESGLKMFVHLTGQLFPGKIVIGEVRGNLLQGVSITDGKLNIRGVEIKADKFSASWDVSGLLHRKVLIHDLSGQRLRITLPAPSQQETPPQKSSAVLDGSLLRLPVEIHLKNLLLQDSILARKNQSAPLRIDTLAGGLDMTDAGITIRHGKFDTPGFSIDCDGTLGTAGKTSDGIHGTWRFEPGKDVHSLAGEYLLSGNVSQSELTVSLKDPAPAKVVVSLTDLATLRWQAHLEAKRIPAAALVSSLPQVTASLTADLQGEMFGYTGHLEGEIAKEKVGTIKFATDLSGNEHEVEVHPAQLTGDMGKIQISAGTVNWQEGLSWNGDLAVENLDPGFWQKQYAGKLNLGVHSKGQLKAGQPEGELQIDHLAGQLRGYPVSGSGKLTFYDQKLEATNVHLASGRSELSMHGSVQDNIDLQLSLSSPDIGEVLHGGTGAVTLTALVKGTLHAPEVTGELNVQNVHWSDYFAKSVHGQLSGKFSDQEQFTTQLEARQVSWASWEFDELSFAGKGSIADHLLEANLANARGRIAVELAAGLKNEQWTGTLRKLQADTAAQGRWNLNGSTSFLVGRDHASVDNLCLNSANGKICATGGWVQKDGRWKANLDGTGLDLGQFVPFLHTTGAQQNKLNLTAALEGDTSRITAGKGRFELASGGIADFSHVPEWENVQLEQIVGTATLEAERMMINLSGTVNRGHAVDGQVEIANFGVFASPRDTMPLKGRIKVHLQDIDFVGPITQYTVRPSGAVDGELDLAGTLAHPELTGNARLTGGTVDLTTFGVSLSEITAKAGLEWPVLHISAHARSGPGQMEGSGTLEFDHERGVIGDFRLKGKNFDLFHRPEYDIRTNPDVQIVFDTNSGTLSGFIFVPHALLVPEQIKNTVSLSDDVIFIDTPKKAKILGWHLNTELKVELGDDVHFEGYGLTGLLHGKLDVSKKQGNFMTGKGLLTLDQGKFSIYGRILDVVRGRVIFNDGPIDDPEIDARTQKMVSSESSGVNDYTVGVDVSGTAKDLQFKLYSDPFMEESDILAFLVVGRSISGTSSQEKNLLSSAATMLGLNKSADLLEGITNLLPIDEFFFEGGSNARSNNSTDAMSFVIGKRVTNDLFVGYDHNFVEQKGEFKIRYNLGHGFAIETRSSGNATSGDVYYSFEK